MKNQPTGHMRECRACGKSIAGSATKCPHCGKQYTSKVLVAALILLGLLALLLFVWAPYQANMRELDKAAERLRGK